jgi:hypothetical protein
MQKPLGFSIQSVGFPSSTGQPSRRCAVRVHCHRRMRSWTTQAMRRLGEIGRFPTGVRNWVQSSCSSTQLPIKDVVNMSQRSTNETRWVTVLLGSVFPCSHGWTKSTRCFRSFILTAPSRSRMYPTRPYLPWASSWDCPWDRDLMESQRVVQST